MAEYTPGPWIVGCQNDALFVIAGRAPSLNNDHPWHDAPRVALAKVYGPSEGDCLPIDADTNARLIAAAPELLEALQFLADVARSTRGFSPMALKQADRAIAKATDGEG